MPEKIPEIPSQIEPTGKQATAVAVRRGFKELGASGTNLYAGFLSEDHDSQLNGQTAFIQFDKMRRSDAQVRGTLHAMELPIRTTRWYIEPGTDENGDSSEEDLMIAKFVEDALFNKMETTWDDTLRQILTMLTFGVSVFEKVWKFEGDKIILKKLAWRKPHTIQRWECEDGSPGITQQLPSSKPEGDNAGQNLISIPASKLLIFTNQREGDNYEGISILRSSYKHWKIKNTLYLFDNIKHERGSVGLPVITLPQNATEQEQLDAEILVQNVRSTDNSGVVLPYGHTFEFKSPSSGGAAGKSDIFESINHHNREIAKNILAQFLELGNTESGSRSLSEDQSSLFLLSLGAVTNSIRDILCRFLITEMVNLNFNNVKSYPKVAYDKLGDIQYAEFATALRDLVDKGIIIPDATLEEHVRGIYNLPNAVKDSPEDAATRSKAKPTEVINKIDGAVPPEKKVDKPIPPDVKAHEHLDEEDEVFKELCMAFNNEAIIALQNEGWSPEDILRIKKKGFVFNDYEKESPRPLTFAERRVNFTSLKRALDSFGNQLEEKLSGISTKLREDILLQVKKAVANNDTAALGQIKARFKNAIAQELTDIQKELFEIGKRGAANEMGVPMPPTRSEVKGVMRVQNDIAVDTAIKDTENYVRSAVSEGAQRAGGVSNYPSTEAVATATAVLDKRLTTILNGLKTVATVGAVNMGRASIFERYPEKVYAMQYSAILDERTTMHCSSLDGRVVEPGSAEYRKYSPPQHYGCRSVWVEILQDDSFKPNITGIPQSIIPTKSIDDFKDPTQPIALLKNSPAIRIIQQEIADRQSKLDALKESNTFPNRQAVHEEAIANLQKSIKGKFQEAAHDLVIEVLKADGINFLEA